MCRRARTPFELVYQLACGADLIVAHDEQPTKAARDQAAQAKGLGLIVVTETAADAITADLEVEFRRESSRERRDQPEVTKRQAEVLQAMTRNDTYAEIGEELGISAHTVKFHLDVLGEALGVRPKHLLLWRAAELGILVLPPNGGAEPSG